MDLRVTPENESALRFWRAGRRDPNAVDTIARQFDESRMLAKVTLSRGQVGVTISKRTWERGEGHFPAVGKFFQAVAAHPLGVGLECSFIVWLEDALWSWDQMYSSFYTPIFAYGRARSDPTTFLIPDGGFLGDEGYVRDLEEIEAIEGRYTWDTKRASIFWRGAASGIGFETDDWAATARGRLVSAGASINDREILDAKLTKIGHLPPAQQRAVEEAGVVGGEVPFSEFLGYRYIVDADGYSWAWRSLFLKLASRSVTLRVESDFEHWFSSRLVPWEHYIPLRRDVTEVERLYRWLRDNDESVRRMPTAARELIRTQSYQTTVGDAATLLRALFGSIV